MPPALVVVVAVVVSKLAAELKERALGEATDGDDDEEEEEEEEEDVPTMPNLDIVLRMPRRGLGGSW